MFSVAPDRAVAKALQRLQRPMAPFYVGEYKQRTRADMTMLSFIGHKLHALPDSTRNCEHPCLDELLDLGFNVARAEKHWEGISAYQYQPIAIRDLKWSTCQRSFRMLESHPTSAHSPCSHCACGARHLSRHSARFIKQLPFHNLKLSPPAVKHRSCKRLKEDGKPRYQRHDQWRGQTWLNDIHPPCVLV